MKPLTLLTLYLALVVANAAVASERLTGIACRSVHLQYPAPEAVAFYNELTVEQSAEGTYFMACGFHRGYFGIQQRRGDDKVVLFSVWDAGNQNDPNATPEARRVQVLDQGADVLVKRFGGEGTGGQSFYNYDWKTGETCRFLVTARPEDKRTVYTGYFYVAADKRWQMLAAFSTPTQGQPLRGYYSFVEDFRRNRVSAEQVRKGLFGNGWIRSQTGEWSPLASAKFTADGNRAVNINAGVQDGRFYLATGGDTANSDAPLWSTIELPDQQRQAPTDLPDIR